MSRAFVPPTECPVCGAAVPRNARACPECGADERSGWSEADTRYDGLDLPDEAFEGDEPPRKRPARGGTNPLWIGVAVALLAALILVFVFRR